MSSVRQHSDIDQPKALDVLVTELSAFKDISEDLVILEISTLDGRPPHPGVLAHC